MVMASDLRSREYVEIQIIVFSPVTDKALARDAEGKFVERIRSISGRARGMDPRFSVFFIVFFRFLIEFWYVERRCIRKLLCLIRSHLGERCFLAETITLEKEIPGGPPAEPATGNPPHKERH